MGKEVWRWSAAKTVKRIAEKEISTREVAAAHFARLHAVNLRLNALGGDIGEPMVAARRVDKLQAKGRKLRSLHGAPVVISQNMTCSPILAARVATGVLDGGAEADSPVVANVRKAGAVVVASASAPEISSQSGFAHLFGGSAQNPWGETYTCGGGAGGLAAVVAAGGGALGFGADIGGSLRWSAHCCGIAALKPTLGRAPIFYRDGPKTLPALTRLMLAEGPIARCVKDLRLGFGAMCAYDARDPFYTPAPLNSARLKRRLRVAKAKIPTDMDCDLQILSAFHSAADFLSMSGAAVEETDWADFEEIWRLWFDVLATEVFGLTESGAHESGDFLSIRNALIDRAYIRNRDGLLQALIKRSDHIRDWQAKFEDYDVLLAPVTLLPMPSAKIAFDDPDAIFRLLDQNIRFLSLVNILGFPSVVAPVGLFADQPVGVQFIGPRFREDLCLQAAQSLEAQAGRLVKKLWRRMDENILYSATLKQPQPISA